MLRLFNRFLSIETPPPLALETKRCLRAGRDGFDCRYCLDVCPSEALSLVDKRIVLDATACTACMRCTAVCPNDALVATVDIADLLARSRHRGADDLSACLDAQRLSAGGVQSRLAGGGAGIFADDLLLYGACGRCCAHRLDAEDDRRGLCTLIETVLRR